MPLVVWLVYSVVCVQYCWLVCVLYFIGGVLRQVQVQGPAVHERRRNWVGSQKGCVYGYGAVWVCGGGSSRPSEIRLVLLPSGGWQLTVLAWLEARGKKLGAPILAGFGTHGQRQGSTSVNLVGVEPRSTVEMLAIQRAALYICPGAEPQNAELGPAERDSHVLERR